MRVKCTGTKPQERAKGVSNSMDVLHLDGSMLPRDEPDSSQFVAAHYNSMWYDSLHRTAKKKNRWRAHELMGDFTLTWNRLVISRIDEHLELGHCFRWKQLSQCFESYQFCNYMPYSTKNSYSREVLTGIFDKFYNNTLWFCILTPILNWYFLRPSPENAENPLR